MSYEERIGAARLHRWADEIALGIREPLRYYHTKERDVAIMALAKTFTVSPLVARVAWFIVGTLWGLVLAI